MNAEEATGEEKSSSWSELRELETMDLVLLQHEASRLSKRLGKGHPLTRLELRPSFDRINDLKVEDEISRISVPKVEAEKALIFGRITDEKLRGAKVEVSLEDPKGATLMRTETDSAGLYALVVDPAVLPKEGVNLFVVSRKGAVLHREPKAIKIAAGERALVEVALSGEKLSLIRPAPSKVPGDDEARARRRAPGRGKSPDVRKIRGIGPKRATDLKKARITDVSEFLEASNETLARILGSVDLAAMRREARRLRPS